jgi:hypothetical protein
MRARDPQTSIASSQRLDPGAVRLTVLPASSTADSLRRHALELAEEIHDLLGSRRQDQRNCALGAGRIWPLRPQSCRARAVRRTLLLHPPPSTAWSTELQRPCRLPHLAAPPALVPLAEPRPTPPPSFCRCRPGGRRRCRPRRDGEEHGRPAAVVGPTAKQRSAWERAARVGALRAARWRTGFSVAALAARSPGRARAEQRGPAGWLG